MLATVVLFCCCCCCINVLYQNEKFLLCSWLPKSYYHEEMVNSIKCFSAFIEMIVFPLFILLMWWIALLDFQMLKQPCTPEINCTWWFIILFKDCWERFTSILLNILHPCSWRILICNCFSFNVFVRYWYQYYVNFIKCVRNCPLYFEKIYVEFAFSECFTELLWSHLGWDCSLWKDIFIKKL